MKILLQGMLEFEEEKRWGLDKIMLEMDDFESVEDCGSDKY